MDLVKEAGLEKPGPDFTDSIMSKITPKTASQVYRPLISKTAWIVIGLIAVAVSVFLLLVPMGTLAWGGQLMDGLSLEAAPSWQPELSKTTLYALGCLALFLVQIPFLKRLIVQRA